jgi:hypothetical protein
MYSKRHQVKKKKKKKKRTRQRKRKRNCCLYKQFFYSNLTNFADSQQKCIIFIHNTPVASGTGTNMDEARKIASRKACQIIQNSQHLVSSLCTCHDSD